MDFGIMFANAGFFATPEGAGVIAGAAESSGFESVWTVEHVIVPDGYESEYPYDRSGKMPGGETLAIPDPLIWLTWVAAKTTTLNVGTGIMILPQRNPLILAKACASLDVLSGGRFRLGVGAGWLKEEFDALGVPFAGRGRRVEEYIAAMRALWDDDKADFDGEFVQFSQAISFPKPSSGRVPIIIGGHSDVSARRAGRIGDGFFPGKGDNQRLAELLKIMSDSAEEAGRNPSTIEVTTGGAAAFAPDPVEALGELADLGISRVVIPPLSFDPAALPDKLAEFGETVIAAVNS